MITIGGHIRTAHNLLLAWILKNPPRLQSSYPSVSTPTMESNLSLCFQMPRSSRDNKRSHKVVVRSPKRWSSCSPLGSPPLLPQEELPQGALAYCYNLYENVNEVMLTIR